MKHSLAKKLSLLCCVIVFCVPSSVFASQYTVSPLVIDKELEKRDTLSETITLTNNSSGKIRIFPTVNEIAVEEGGAIKTFVEPSMTADRTTSITSWIEVGRGRIELEPGETKLIPLTVHVNPEVSAGEYHAFIGFPEGSNRPEAEKLIYSGSVPGTILRIGVDKVQDQFLKIEKFSVDRFVKGSTEGQISVILQNPGDDPVTPGGEIIFYDNHGIEINAIALNTGTTTIEGKKSASFTLQVPKDMEVGKYKAFLSVEYGKDQKASLNDTSFFYVLPLKQVLIIFFVVLTLSMLLALYVHRRFDREEDDYGATNVAMYVRTTRSSSKDHDINLSNKDSN